MAPQSWPITLIPYVPAAGYGEVLSEGYGAATAAQSWPITLLTSIEASGYGEVVSEGYGAATAAQSWPITLLTDEALLTAEGYGEVLSEGYGAAAVAEIDWYDVEATVAGYAFGYGEVVSSGYGAAVQPPAFVLHPQGMVPGTVIGAYRRWEWKGSVAAKLNAGPGAAVRTTTVADDLTATFTLPPGEYVAYAAAYPTRRLFFMVTAD